MRWLEAAIAAVSPRLALDRARARATLALLRGYEAAARTRKTGIWKAGSGSANAEIVPDLSRLRNSSRMAIRDNPFAKAASEAWVSNAVGTGITATPDKRAREAWQRWIEVCDQEGDLDYYGLQGLAARTAFESGEALILMRPIPYAAGDVVPLRLQIVEADRLDLSKTMALKDGGAIIAGVEFDASGRKVRYWLYPEHPGELIAGRGRSGRWESQPVDARYVIHCFEKLRPGQCRGVPRLHASLKRLGGVDEYQDAELLRKKIEACITAIAQTDSDRLLGTGEGDSSAAGAKTEKIQPGTIMRIGAGESISLADVRPSQGYAEYNSEELHAIAAGAGCTYEQLTGNYSQVTYLSARASLQEFRRMVGMWQWLTFIPQVCRRIERGWEDQARAAGIIGPKPLTWLNSPMSWDWIDPAKEVASTKEEVRGGLESLSEALRMRGYDPESKIDEIAEERKMLADKGISLDSILATIAAAPQQQDANYDASTKGKK